MKLMRTLPIHSYYNKFDSIYKLKMSKDMLTHCRGGSRPSLSTLFLSVLILTQCLPLYTESYKPYFERFREGQDPPLRYII